MLTGRKKFGVHWIITSNPTFKFLHFAGWMDGWIFFKFKRLVQNTDRTCYLQLLLGNSSKSNAKVHFYCQQFDLPKQQQTEREMQ